MSRHPVLDEVKRGQIVALASSGFSRRSIARYVGCAAATIENTAERLPAFAEQLQEAERKFVQTHSDNIARHAANSWRASAWLMEHLQPEEFGRRSAKAPTPVQNASQFATGSRAVLAAVPLDTRGALERVTRDMFAKLRNGNSDLAADPQPSIPTDHSTEQHPPGDETPPTLTAPYPAPPYPAQSPLRIDNADPRAVARLFKLIKAMLAEKLRFQAIDVFCEATGVAEQVACAAVNSIAQNHPEDAVEVAGLADPRSINAAPAAQPAEPRGLASLDAPPADALPSPIPTADRAAPPPTGTPMADPAPTGIPIAVPHSRPAASSALLLLLAFFLGGLAFHAQSEHFPLDVPPVPLNNSPLPADSALHPAPESSAPAPGQLAWPEQQIGRLGRAHHPTAPPSPGIFRPRRRAGEGRRQEWMQRRAAVNVARCSATDAWTGLRRLSAGIYVSPLPSVGEGPGVRGPVAGLCSKASPIMPATCSHHCSRANRFSIRSTRNPCWRSHASRRSSCSRCDGCACPTPSSSRINRRS